VFRKSADFSGSTFSKSPMFLGTLFASGADFSLAFFRNGAEFNNATFDGTASFVGARFCLAASTQEETCGGPLPRSGAIDFAKATFKGDALFPQIQIQTMAPILFMQAQFTQPASFDGCQIKGGGEDAVIQWSFSAVQSLKQTLSFYGCRLSNVSLGFKNATLVTLDLTGVVLDHSTVDLAETTYASLRSLAFDYDSLKPNSNTLLQRDILNRLEANFRAENQQRLSNEAAFRSHLLDRAQQDWFYQIMDFVFSEQLAGYLVDASNPLRWTCIIILMGMFFFGGLRFLNLLTIVEPTTTEKDQPRSSNVLMRLFTIKAAISPSAKAAPPAVADQEALPARNSTSSFQRIQRSAINKVKSGSSSIAFFLGSMWLGFRFSVRVFSEVVFSDMRAESDKRRVRFVTNGFAYLERVLGIILIAAITIIVLNNVPALKSLLGQ
jgi:uncharacterized protein YjbI with pentapeptide repeats